MIKYIAIVRPNKNGVVLDVVASEIPSVVAKEKAAGSIIIGEFDDPHTARRNMLLGIQGYRPRFNKLSDPRFTIKRFA